MLDFILFRKTILFSLSYINIFKIELKIHEKLQVKQTKLQICQSQAKSDIDWKCFHYVRKWMASLDSKNIKLKTKSNQKLWYQGKTETDK